MRGSVPPRSAGRYAPVWHARPSLSVARRERNGGTARPGVTQRPSLTSIAEQTKETARVWPARLDPAAPCSAWSTRPHAVRTDEVHAQRHIRSRALGIPHLHCGAARAASSPAPRHSCNSARWPRNRHLCVYSDPCMLNIRAYESAWGPAPSGARTGERKRRARPKARPGAARLPRGAARRRTHAARPEPRAV